MLSVFTCYCWLIISHRAARLLRAQINWRGSRGPCPNFFHSNDCDTGVDNKKRCCECHFSAPEPHVATEIGITFAFNLEMGQREMMEEKIKSKDQTGVVWEKVPKLYAKKVSRSKSLQTGGNSDATKGKCLLTLLLFVLFNCGAYSLCYRDIELNPVTSVVQRRDFWKKETCWKSAEKLPPLFTGKQRSCTSMLPNLGPKQVQTILVSGAPFYVTKGFVSGLATFMLTC